MKTQLDFVKNLIKEKLSADLNKGALGSPSRMKLKESDIVSDLSVIRDLQASNLNIVSEVKASSWDGVINLNSLSTLKERMQKLGRALSIDCASINVASYAALLGLWERKIDLNIVTKNASGLEQAMNLADSFKVQDGYDFVIAADAPFSLYLNPYLEQYQRVVKLNSESQKAFRFKGGENEKNLPTCWIYPSSSVEHQLRIAKANPERFNLPLQYKEQELTSLADYRHLNEFMKPGDYVFAWQPLSDYLEANMSFLEIVPGTEFEISISLYAHQRFTEENLLLNSFFDLFVAEWSLVEMDRLKAINRVLVNEQIISDFGRGMGVGTVLSQLIFGAFLSQSVGQVLI